MIMTINKILKKIMEIRAIMIVLKRMIITTNRIKINQMNQIRRILILKIMAGKLIIIIKMILTAIMIIKVTPKTMVITIIKNMFRCRAFR